MPMMSSSVPTFESSIGLPAVVDTHPAEPKRDYYGGGHGGATLGNGQHSGAGRFVLATCAQGRRPIRRTPVLSRCSICV